MAVMILNHYIITATTTNYARSHAAAPRRGSDFRCHGTALTGRAPLSPSRSCLRLLQSRTETLQRHGVARRLGGLVVHTFHGTGEGTGGGQASVPWRAEDWSASCVLYRFTVDTVSVLHGESNKGQASPRTTTAGNSADLAKRNQTPTGYTRAKDAITPQIDRPQAASSQRTHVARRQGCGRIHTVNRRVITQYLHIQSATIHRRCGRNDRHEAPREL